MNLGMNFRGGIERLPGVLEAVIARINTLWNKQHTLAGGHKGLTSDSIKVDSISVGKYWGIFENLRGLPLIGNIVKPAKTTLMSQGITEVVGDLGIDIHTPELTLESHESVALTIYEPELSLYRNVRTTGNVAMNKDGPVDILLNEIDQVPDNRKALIRHGAGHLSINLLNNLETVSPCGITWHRQAETIYLRKHANVEGTMQAASLGTTPINGANIIPGTLPTPVVPANVALKDASNNWTATQTFPSPLTVSGANGQFWMRDTSSPVNQTLWRMLGYGNGNLYIESLKDPLGGIDSQFGFTRAGYFSAGGINAGVVNASSSISATGTATISAGGQVTGNPVVSTGLLQGTHLEASPYHMRCGTGCYAGTDFYEKGRATPLGHWIANNWAAANFYALGPMVWTVPVGAQVENRYCFIGNTMIWSGYWANSATSGTVSPNLYINTPAGVVPPGSDCAYCEMYVAGEGWLPGTVETEPGIGRVLIQKFNKSNHAAVGASYIRFTITIRLV